MCDAAASLEMCLIGRSHNEMHSTNNSIFGGVNRKCQRAPVCGYNCAFVFCVCVCVCGGYILAVAWSRVLKASTCFHE